MSITRRFEDLEILNSILSFDKENQEKLRKMILEKKEVREKLIELFQLQLILDPKTDEKKKEIIEIVNKETRMEDPLTLEELFYYRYDPLSMPIMQREREETLGSNGFKVLSDERGLPILIPV